jgi:hypothetical protein
MKNFVKKCVFSLALIAPMLGYAGKLCSVGYVLVTADNTSNDDLTAFYINDITTNTKVVQRVKWKSYDSSVKNSRRVDNITKDLRAALMNGIPVRTYSSVNDCNDIDEVRLCIYPQDCM